MINIKLDKAGGLTEALAVADGCARARGSAVMVGSMVATSLAMAPALILAQGAESRTSTGRCCSRGTVSRGCP